MHYAVKNLARHHTDTRLQQRTLTRLINEHVTEDDAIETAEYVHFAIVDDRRVTESGYAPSDFWLIKSVPLSTLCTQNN